MGTAIKNTYVLEYQNAIQEERFGRVLDVLYFAGMLFSNRRSYKDPIKTHVNDFLWAAQYEPRIYEVLPATKLLMPDLIEGDCEKLSDIIQHIKEGKEVGPTFVDFIPYKKMKFHYDFRSQ